MSGSTNDQVFDVAVIGFGMAGAHATKAVLDAGRSVVVVEPSGCHQFLTRLAAVAGGTAPATDAAVGISEMFDVDVVMERATGITAEGGDDVAEEVQIVGLHGGGGVRARRVVITAGAEPVAAPVDGLDFARPLRSAADALDMRAWLDEAEVVVIIGGGPTGCQLAGAIASARPDISCTLIDGSDRLMSSFSSSLGRHAKSVLTGRGVQVELGDKVEEIHRDSVRLRSGRVVDGTAAWTAGYEADMSAFGETDDGRLRIEADGRLLHRQGVFAAGDCAMHVDRSGDAYPMSAQIAAQAGEHVARNVVRTLAGEATRPLNLKDRGWVVDLGGGRGVADLLGVPLAAPLLDRIVPLIHDAIDIRNLWQLGGLDFVGRFRPGASDSQPVPSPGVMTVGSASTSE